jgi:hypothetical protein
MNQFSDENHQAEGGSDPVDKRFNRRSVLKGGIAAGAGVTALLLGRGLSEQNQSRRANTSELLDLAMQAHGGLERWRQVQSLDVRLSLTGGLLRLKGYPESMPNVNMKTDARRPAVTIMPYAQPAERDLPTCQKRFAHPLAMQPGREPQTNEPVLRKGEAHALPQCRSGELRGHRLLRLRRHGDLFFSPPLDIRRVAAYTSNMSAEKPRPFATPCLCTAL